MQDEKTSTTPYGNHGGRPGGFRGGNFFVSQMFRLILASYSLGSPGHS